MAIYARLEDGTYAEVTGVYKTDGTEITEIFQGDRLVYSASNEIYGSLPLYYNGKGYDLTDYLISGNAIQDGTPSPEAPVDVVGCGVRTNNLYDGNADIGNIVPCFMKKGVYYTASLMADTKGGTPPQILMYDKEKNRIDYHTLLGNPAVERMSRTFKHDFDVYYVSLAKNGANGIRDVTVVEGYNEKSFIPYGYKLPLTVNGVEYPIYLGTVPTTRQIARVVLTGEEKWRIHSISSTYRYFCYPNSPEVSGAQNGPALCNYAESAVTSARRLIIDDSEHKTVEDFVANIRDHYLSGDPYVVYYVRNYVVTDVVNEPLYMLSNRYGTYADTVSFAQAGVTMPTVNGANVLDMNSPVKPSEVYIKGKGIKPTGYGQLADVNGVNILDKDGRPIYVHGQ